MVQPPLTPGPPTVPNGIPVRDELARLPAGNRPELIIITGMSGAGRSRAAAALEDLNWYVVDNLPPRLLGTFAEMMTGGSRVTRLAAVVDVRSREFFTEMVSVLNHLREIGLEFRTIFLEATDEELVRRYETVRRPHPLQGDGRIMDGIAEERTILKALRDRADVIMDTSNLSVHDLARRVRELVGVGDDERLRLTVMSFGFKYGLPLDADHVVDVRFLANPYWVSELRHLTGHDEQVRKYVLERPGAIEFVERYVAAIEPILDGYVAELKPYVTIAVGCTGGKHRSVAISEAVAARLRKAGHSVRTIHRDLGRE